MYYFEQQKYLAHEEMFAIMIRTVIMIHANLNPDIVRLKYNFNKINIYRDFL